MTSLSKQLITIGNQKPEIQTVKADELIGPEIELASFNLKTVKSDDLDMLRLNKVIRKYWLHV